MIDFTFRWWRNLKKWFRHSIHDTLIMKETFKWVNIKSIIFWDMTRCSPLKLNRRFGETYRLHLQGRRNRFSKPARKQVASLCDRFLCAYRLLESFVPIEFYIRHGESFRHAWGDIHVNGLLSIRNVAKNPHNSTLPGGPAAVHLVAWVLKSSISIFGAKMR
jgi:hypothetical protein